MYQAAINKVYMYAAQLDLEKVQALVATEYDPRRSNSEKSAAIVALTMIIASKTIGSPMISLGGQMHLWTVNHYAQLRTKDLEDLKDVFATACGWSVVDTAMSRFHREFMKVLYRQADPGRVFRGDYELVRGICYEDGVLTIDKNGKEQFTDGHDPKRITTFCVPHRYKSTAPTSDVWDAFITRMIPNQVERQYVLASLANGIAGDPLNAQKMLILLGAAGAGKSTLIEAVINVVGQTNVMRIDTLSQLTSDDSRHRMRLGHSSLCVCGDASDKLGNKDVLKQVISKEDITARQLYNEPINVTPRSTILVATNELGFAHTLSDSGLARRLDIIIFRKGLAEGERDGLLGQKLKTPEALAAIGMSLSRALVEHSERNGGKLIRPSLIVESLAMLRRDGDALLSFFATVGLGVDENDSIVWIHQDDLQREFLSYCGINGFKAMSMRRLKSKLRSLGLEEVSKRGAKHCYKVFVTDDSLRQETSTGLLNYTCR
jgi:phage/plasmid-associated DNA primase